MLFNTNLMNRFLLSTLPCVLYASSVLAQGQPAKPGVIPPVAGKALSSPVNDTAIENRLVALALDGPEYDGSAHLNKINELELKKAKATWLNLLSLSTQLNDQSFKPQTQVGQVAYVYPKYFFGITIPLGIIFSQGGTVKTARESLAYAQDQQKVLARQIRANVLTKYKQYKLDEDLIEMESELINDVLAISTQAEDNFKNGTITVDIYISAQRTKNEEMVKLKNLQLQRDLVQIDLERMIGTSLDEVIHPKPVPVEPLYKPAPKH